MVEYASTRLMSLATIAMVAVASAVASDSQSSPCMTDGAARKKGCRRATR